MATLEEVNIEWYTSYAIGMAIFITRIFGKILLVGIRGLSLDDAFTVTFWTLDLILVWYIGIHGSSVGQDPVSAERLDEATVESFRIGDKLTFAGWICYICIIWSMKGIILCYYDQLTMNLWQNKLAKRIRWLALVTFVIALLFQFTLCVAVQEAWQVKPYPSDKCVFRKENYILYPTLSIIVDLGIMAIPLPLLWQAQLPIRRKIILGIFFTSGIFVVVATILRTVYSLRSLLDLLVAVQWTTREFLVTAFVVSAPSIKPLFSRRLWGRRGLTTRSVTGCIDRNSSNESDLLPRKGSKGNCRPIAIESQGVGGQSETSAGGKAFEMSLTGWYRKSNDLKLTLPGETSLGHIVGCPCLDEEAGIRGEETEDTNNLP
ncbi:hypothetical protein F4677DRAFT_460586 [Hypoxylon crocopeplum]|nr:hypothetical protein F4677DRAFT_460586 [Hypoxylon crocopeplum]